MMDRKYDITWVTRKGYKPNQNGQEWHMTAVARNKTEARKLFDEWWYGNHSYHAFHIEITPKGEELTFFRPDFVNHINIILRGAHDETLH